MSKTRTKIPKSLVGRLVECEAHTMFLDTALKNMAKDPIWYKQVAGELRVLVADHKPANRLIQTLMDALGVGMSVHAPATPPFKWDVVRNGGKVEPWDGSIPFKDYCEIGLACVVDGRPYKNGEFIRLVAQHEGSSHESDSLDPALHKSYNLILGSLPSHVVQLACIGRTVRNVAVDFIRYVIANRGYNPRYNWGELGNRSSDPPPGE